MTKEQLIIAIKDWNNEIRETVNRQLDIIYDMNELNAMFVDGVRYVTPEVILKSIFKYTDDANIHYRVLDLFREYYMLDGKHKAVNQLCNKMIEKGGQ